MIVMSVINLIFNSRGEWLDYSKFYYYLKSNLDNPIIQSVKKTDSLIQGEFTKEKGGGRFYVYVPSEDKELIELLKRNVSKFEVEPPRISLVNIFYSLGPTILFMLFLWYIAYRGTQQVGGHIWTFGKSKARMIEKENLIKTTFRDVAGVDEAKEELREVIEFLKDPKKFQRLGGRIPKGVLLVGPPGCGKTLLAKAVAGEADVPFFSISGSDFVELFVGVGASRVRDLFEQAKKAAKVSGKGGIIFIDEIDAVGRQRFAGIGGGHDEREQTLNQLLVEMDGFQTQEGIIVIAATNRPDVLDPALLRPGRFDRHIVIDLPDIKGREEILKVHTRKIKLAKDIDLSVIAKQTPGFSGADLENLCNESALLAARKNKESVEIEELQEAMERIIAGPERKSRVISKKEKEIIALHESGHALLSLLLPNVDPMHKVSIVPRGVYALGYTLQMPLRDRYLLSRSELLDRICVLLGGRAAEEIMLGEITTGAQNDLEAATKMARRMVTEFGMSSKIGNITLGRREGPVFLGRDLIEHKDYSEETSKLIDTEIKNLVEDSYQRAKKLLETNKDKLKLLVDTLLEKEILDSQEVKKILGIESLNSKEYHKEEVSQEKNQPSPKE
ncbi:MAG: ATP-dependent zinc metalloprotease FtsH [Candidatus Omnitrophica bacterium]|nr:ATP-dependent zinc metalloprotease FtsH [Candidatus Omnitrophota bacterium]MCM8827191.1 ATP-dependent zinc metalloprotease FtsH [Candidatus Omnitrophota bacterium]